MAFKGWETAESLGDSRDSIEADGVFVLVLLEIENLGDEPGMLTDEGLTLVDERNVEYEPVTDAAPYVTRDDRFQFEGLTSYEIQPGEAIDRAIVFDVPRGHTYTPVFEGGTEEEPKTWYYELGTVEAST